MIEVEILADSVNPAGRRLTTFKFKYPRFIHAEVMTHRTHSRNAASSRAIPFSKLLAMVNEDPAYPERFGLEQKGMNMGTDDPLKESIIKSRLERLCGYATETLLFMSKHFGLHKSILNRYLEPWSHITVVITASDFGWANFFALRASPMADDTFQVLAYRALHKYLRHEPRKIQWGRWHIPEFAGGEWTNNLNRNLRIATARCARLSYLTHEGTSDADADVAMHDRLMANKHWSPFEHVALASEDRYPPSNFDTEGQRCGWYQYRKMMVDENQIAPDLEAILKTKPDWITL